MKKKQNLLNNGLKNNEKKVDFNLLFITVGCMKRNGLEALNFQHKINYNRSKNFEYTNETIMFYTRCYTQYGFI